MSYQHHECIGWIVPQVLPADRQKRVTPSSVLTDKQVAGGAAVVFPILIATLFGRDGEISISFSPMNFTAPSN
jgi:hypothetical protein